MRRFRLLVLTPIAAALFGACGTSPTEPVAQPNDRARFDEVCNGGTMGAGRCP